MGTYTTDNKAVSNSIGLAQKYLPILDGVYKTSARSSILDMANSRIRFGDGATVQVFKTAVDGLGDYARNAGFVTGDLTSGWEDFTLTKDRGRSFLVDAMDNEESLGMAFGTLAGEFLRTQVAPEIDAYRFATYASVSGISAATPADLSSSDDIPGIISAGEYQMNEDEVPYDGRILFVSEAVYMLLRNQLIRIIENGEDNIRREVEYFDGMRVVRVPQVRFNTAITLYDGTTAGQEAGGYVVTAGGYPINFMIVHPSAVIQVVKHAVPRIFSPAVNQSADAWMFQYRVYHDAFALDNKVKGIYIHTASTANS